jgi:hypothetical protein
VSTSHTGSDYSNVEEGVRVPGCTKTLWSRSRACRHSWSMTSALCC